MSDAASLFAPDPDRRRAMMAQALIRPPPGIPGVSDNPMAHGPDWGNAVSSTMGAVGDAIARQRAKSIALGLLNPDTGMPTPAGWTHAGEVTAFGLGTGDTGGGLKRGITPAERFTDAFDAAHAAGPHADVSHVHFHEHGPAEVEISHIGVDPESRGKGIGNDLMGTATDLADQHGVTLHASPASDADPATGLGPADLANWYERWGFDVPGGGDRLTRHPDPEAFVPPPPPPPPPGIKAYHGSPHAFDAFDLSKIGTGEGAQAYGHGLYFAGNEGVARSYRDQLSGNLSPADNQAFRDLSGQHADLRKQIGDLQDLMTYHSMQRGQPVDPNWGELGVEPHPEVSALFQPKIDKLTAQAADTKAQMDQILTAPRDPGSMYEVNINADPEHLLDWDKPITQQSQHVQDTLAANPHLTGGLRTNTDPTGWTVETTNDNPYSGQRDITVRDPNGQMRSMRSGFRGTDEEALRQHLEGQVSTGKEAYETLTQNAARERESLQKWFAGKAADGDTRAFPNEQAQLDALQNPHAYAAQQLRDAGIPGIKYLDGGSRSAGEGTHNYVSFSDKNVDILRKYGIAGLIGGGAAATAAQPQGDAPQGDTPP